MNFKFWKAKEVQYVDRIEQDLAEIKAEHMRLVHQKALIEAAIAASLSRQHLLAECLGVLRETLEKAAADKAAGEVAKA